MSILTELFSTAFLCYCFLCSILCCRYNNPYSRIEEYSIMLTLTQFPNERENKMSTFRAVFNWVSKVISRFLWFCIATLCDWLNFLAPLSQPIRSKTKTNRYLLARVSPRLAPATCICFELWLIVCLCLKWPANLFWFWSYDTQL